MNSSFELLFEVLNSFLKEEKLNTGEINEETLGELLLISKKHDLAHIVAEVLYNSGAIKSDTEIAQYFKQAQINAVLRFTRQDYAKEQIYKLFEEEKITFLPLKGSVVRDYYKEPYMRTSGDLDILVEETKVHHAKKLLCEKLGFSIEDENRYHDISLYTPEGVHIELHFNILEHTENIDRLLSQAWTYAVGDGYKKSMTPEYFMFHHIAHMYYHFVNGGCGLRPFVDLYILRKNLNFSEKNLKKLCDECNITKFYYSILELSDIWFGNGKHNKITKIIQNYILTGGVYGSIENKTAINESAEKNKFVYIMKRIFMPYGAMVYRYPVLKKHKWLYPATVLLRMGEALSPARRKRAVREMQMVKSIDQNSEKSIEEIIKFFELQ